MSTAYPSDTTAPLDAVPPQRPTDVPAVTGSTGTAGLSTPNRPGRLLCATQVQRSIARWRESQKNDKARVAARA